MWFRLENFDEYQSNLTAAHEPFKLLVRKGIDTSNKGHYYFDGDGTCMFPSLFGE